MVKNSRKTVKIAKMTIGVPWYTNGHFCYFDCSRHMSTKTVPTVYQSSKTCQKQSKDSQNSKNYYCVPIVTCLHRVHRIHQVRVCVRVRRMYTKPKIWVLAVTSPIPAFFPRTHLQTRISLTDFVSQWVYAVFMYYLPCQAEQVDNAGIACFAESWRCDATQRSTYRSNNSHTRIWACALASALRHD